MATSMVRHGGNLEVRLSTQQLNSINTHGMYNDGNGLYLKITKAGNKSWICRVRHPVTKRLIDRKLGTPSNLSLKAARTLCARERIAIIDSDGYPRGGVKKKPKPLGSTPLNSFGDGHLSGPMRSTPLNGPTH